MVAELKSATDWRREGCGDRCALRMVIVPGLLGRQTIEVHDPDAHELHGRALAGDVGARPVVESGPLTLWRRELQLWVDGREVKLSRTQWRLLLAMIDANGALVRSEAILAGICGVAGREEMHLLRVHLSRLRARLGRAAGLIETVGGIGYRFRFLPPSEQPPAPRVAWASLADRGKWALSHAACVRCEKTTSPHRAHGLCSACYSDLRRRGELDRDREADGAP